MLYALYGMRHSRRFRQVQAQAASIESAAVPGNGHGEERMRTIDVQARK
jgi:hypothetical protein